MSKSESTKNWQHGQDKPVGLTSSAFLETPAELLTTSQVRCRRKRKENYDTLNKSVFMALMDTS